MKELVDCCDLADVYLKGSAYIRCGKLNSLVLWPKGMKSIQVAWVGWQWETQSIRLITVYYTLRRNF